MEEFYCYKTLDEIFNEQFNFTSSHYASKKLATLFQKAEPRIRQSNTPIICPKCQSNIMTFNLKRHLMTNKCKRLKNMYKQPTTEQSI